MEVPMPTRAQDQVVGIMLDYGMHRRQLKIQDADNVRGSDLRTELRWLDSYADHEGDEVERILRHAVALYNNDPSQPPFADCLHQAIIWERG